MLSCESGVIALGKLREAFLSDPGHPPYSSSITEGLCSSWTKPGSTKVTPKASQISGFHTSALSLGEDAS